MNWKEELNETYMAQNGLWDGGAIEAFITHDIIRKLIDDIPDQGTNYESREAMANEPYTSNKELKEYLKKKWL